MSPYRRLLSQLFVRPTACLALLVALALSPLGVQNALAAPGNRGDVWLDNVGNPAGPGHEHDPHLACRDINLWGAKLADSAGTYVIDGWPPSGSQAQVYPALGDEPWSFRRDGGDPQVVSVINVKTLVANAVARGDQPHPQQGFHFKLQFSQDPQKHKTFWVDCPAPSGGSGRGGGRGEPNPGEGASPEASPVTNVLPNAAQLPIRLANTGGPAPLLLDLYFLGVMLVVFGLLTGRQVGR